MEARELTIAVEACIVLSGLVLGQWVGEHDDTISDFNGRCAEDEDKALEALYGSFKVQKDLPEEVQEAVQMKKRAERKSYPAWVRFIGGFTTLFAIILCLAAVNLSYFWTFRPVNYFEMIGLKPTVLNERMVGLHIREAMKQAMDLDWFQEYGLGPEVVKKVLSVLRDSDKRQLYDQYGSADVQVITILDMFNVFVPALVSYVGWFALVLFISLSSRRFQKASSACIILMMLFGFFDFCFTFGAYTLRTWAFIDYFPQIATLTTFEQMFMMRMFIYPVTLLAATLYASSRFVDHDELMFRHLIDLGNETIEVERLMVNSIKLSQETRIQRLEKMQNGGSERGQQHRASPPASPAASSTKAAETPEQSKVTKRRGKKGKKA
mmetsp:Transcript_16368/g.25700  ORF Transcript_16368/g.25700 Transcript_16368/m.25700 type:complete len:380 (-) Transcript_16368:1141-2280(-)